MMKRLLFVFLLLFILPSIGNGQSLPVELFDKNARDLMPDAELPAPEPGSPIETPPLPEIALSHEYDFRATRWGATIDSVIDSEQREGYELIPEEQTTRLVYREIRFEGVYCTLEYVFLSGRLWYATYFVPDEKSLYSEIIKKLKYKYGEPEHKMQEYIWYADPIINFKIFRDKQKNAFIELNFLAGVNSDFYKEFE